MELKNLTTKELVDELQKREGVETIVNPNIECRDEIYVYDPTEKDDIGIFKTMFNEDRTGPATILRIID